MITILIKVLVFIKEFIYGQILPRLSKRLIPFFVVEIPAFDIGPGASIYLFKINNSKEERNLT
jgi:hypothetical protein